MKRTIQATVIGLVLSTMAAASPLWAGSAPSIRPGRPPDPLGWRAALSEMDPAPGVLVMDPEAHPAAEAAGQ